MVGCVANDFVDQHRLGEVETLHAVQANVGKRFDLRRSLDALGDHVDFQRLAQIADGLDKLKRGFGLDDGFDQPRIDFQPIRCQTTQSDDTGATAAKVIDDQFDPGLTQFFQAAQNPMDSSSRKALSTSSSAISPGYDQRAMFSDRSASRTRAWQTLNDRFGQLG